MPPLEALVLVVGKMGAPTLFPPFSLVYVVAHDLGLTIQFYIIAKSQLVMRRSSWAIRVYYTHVEVV